jgi:hypothetical protein
MYIICLFAFAFRYLLPSISLVILFAATWDMETSTPMFSGIKEYAQILREAWQ